MEDLYSQYLQLLLSLAQTQPQQQVEAPPAEDQEEGAEPGEEYDEAGEEIDLLEFMFISFRIFLLLSIIYNTSFLRLVIVLALAGGMYLNQVSWIHFN